MAVTTPVRAGAPPATTPGLSLPALPAGADTAPAGRPHGTTLLGMKRFIAADAMVLVSLLVAASRVLLGVHYVSDVSAGLLIGLGWAALCTAVFAAWRYDEGRRVDVVHEGIGTR